MLVRYNNRNILCIAFNRYKVVRHNNLSILCIAFNRYNVS